jgi:tetrathionate reductase subunit B
MGVAAGVTAAVVAPGVVLHSVTAAPRSEAVTSDVRWGMLIDTAKCADGCSACVEACDRENGLNLQANPRARRRSTGTIRRRSGSARSSSRTTRPGV